MRRQDFDGNVVHDSAHSREDLLAGVLVQIYILFARAGQRLLQDIDMIAPGPEHIRLDLFDGRNLHQNREILGKLHSRHSAGHYDIRKQQVDRAGIIAGNPERFIAVACWEDVHSSSACQNVDAQLDEFACATRAAPIPSRRIL